MLQINHFISSSPICILCFSSLLWSDHQVFCFSHRKTKFLKVLIGMVLYLAHVSLNGLKIQTGTWWSWWWSKEWVAINCSKFSKAVETHKLVAGQNWTKIKTDGGSTAHWLGNNLLRLFIKILERGRSVKILFHAVLWMRKGAESKSLNISSRPTRSIDTLNYIVTRHKSSLFQYDAERIHTEQEVENNITTIKPKKFHLPKSRIRILNTVFINMVSIHKEFVTEGKTVNSMYWCLKDYWSRFEERGTILRERQLDHFAPQCPYSI